MSGIVQILVLAVAVGCAMGAWPYDYYNQYLIYNGDLDCDNHNGDHMWYWGNECENAVDTHPNSLSDQHNMLCQGVYVSECPIFGCAYYLGTCAGCTVGVDTDCVDA